MRSLDLEALGRQYWLWCRDESQRRLIGLLTASGRSGEAERVLRDAIAAHESLVARAIEERRAKGDAGITPADREAGAASSKEPEYRAKIAHWYTELARLLNDTNPREAERAYRQAVAEFRKEQQCTGELAGGDRLAESLLRLGKALKATGELEEAEAAFQEIFGIHEKRFAAQPPDGHRWHAIGVAHYRAGDWQGCVAAMENAIEVFRAASSWQWFYLAMAHGQLDDRDEAVAWYNKAVAWMDKYQPRDKELGRFRDEAAAVLGQAEQMPNGEEAFAQDQ
jgi:tetratricopeptide (TPR) repeat protein